MRRVHESPKWKVERNRNNRIQLANSPRRKTSLVPRVSVHFFVVQKRKPQYYVFTWVSEETAETLASLIPTALKMGILASERKTRTVANIRRRKSQVISLYPSRSLCHNRNRTRLQEFHFIRIVEKVAKFLPRRSREKAIQWQPQYFARSNPSNWIAIP